MIKQAIETDIKTAMLAGDKETVSILRTVKSVILDAEVKTGKRSEGLSDEEVIGLLQKEAKKRNEASELYENAGETDRATREKNEAVVISNYLPAMMSEAELQVIIDEVISATDDVSMQKMGQIIGAVKSKVGASGDGALIARLVKDRINQ